MEQGQGSEAPTVQLSFEWGRSYETSRLGALRRLLRARRLRLPSARRRVPALPPVAPPPEVPAAAAHDAEPRLL